MTNDRSIDTAVLAARAWLSYSAWIICVAATYLTLATMSAGIAQAASQDAAAQDRPNVILIMTDDQGYGDLGSTGNEMLKTPNLDQLSRESYCLTNFHVDPTCSETRSALMTGRYSSRTGVWHTIMGRSILRRDETTMADVFRTNGYATGMFGKWHLGDNYPYRPQDRGFDEVLCHGGGGVGQTPDYWGNDYFDDTYFRNGTPESQSGYCTDIFFSAATRFIEKNQDQPFFCYLATNAAHGPFLVEERYAQPYLDRGVPPTMARFYGMIANIDENVGKLRTKLEQLQLDRKTILIFMTDNGTAAGWDLNREGSPDQWQGYNAGMRGRKGSQYEGGHRVPCFVHAPGLGIDAGTSNQLSAHLDLLPTLMDLCDLRVPFDLQFDGESLRSVLSNQPTEKLQQRTLFVHSQRVDHPEHGRKSSVMTQRWRLVDLNELYDLDNDPSQTTNVANDHEDVVQELRSAYDDWWQSISSRFDEYVRIDLGAAESPTTMLTAHDWHPTNGGVPWNQGAISRDIAANGSWAVRVQQSGTYRFTLTSRPPHVEHPITEHAGIARIQIGDAQARKNVASNSKSIEFQLNLVPGDYQLQTWIEPEGEDSRGAYYVNVEYVTDDELNQAESKFEFQQNDRVVLLGNTFVERMQAHNYFESYLSSSRYDLDLEFRNLGWSGDDVYGTARAVFGNREAGYQRLLEDVKKAEPTVIMMAYGGNEAFEGSHAIDDFKRAYTKLLDDLSTITPRIILITPHRFENLGAPLPDHEALNRVRREYGEAISNIGQARNLFVVDLFDPLNESSTAPTIRNRLTDQGTVFNAYGYWRLAPILADKLGLQKPTSIRLELDMNQKESACEGGMILDLESNAEHVALALEPLRLPYSGAPDQTPRGGRMFAPHDLIIVKGLKPGKYGLSVDGQPTVMASQDQWAVGVKIPLGEYAKSTVALRSQIAKRNELFFHYHRPQNETYLFLFRKHEQGNNAVEVEQFEPLIQEADQLIHKLARPSVIQLELNRISD